MIHAIRAAASRDSLEEAVQSKRGMLFLQQRVGDSQLISRSRPVTVFLPAEIPS
jgi:hypothetical protein